MLVTPCQGICKMNPTTNKCIGCFRTLEEITDWTSYTEEQRLNVMQRLYYENDFVFVRLQR
jgi:predicted Fe-S protein YdhL (DUF1289 family)